MQELKDKVAVVTGGASGIGLAMAEAFAGAGMKLVLADIERGALNDAVASLSGTGADVLGVLTDVTKTEQLEALADQAYDAFGAVHVVCNNAGVGIGGPCWTIPKKDWDWILDVNLNAVMDGIRIFVPRMIAQDNEGHIVNTASIAGLTTAPSMAPYFVSKHGVVALSECLHHELQLTGSKLRVSVVCPAWVNTKIIESDRNRPGGRVTDEELDPMFGMIREGLRATMPKAMPPKEVADLVLDAVQHNKFYVLPHQAWKPSIETRMHDILEERDPTLSPPPDGASLLGFD
jgi:NAD(P)-dependent dehydrogenase (short-subunit alcohol dehydrogenase family)